MICNFFYFNEIKIPKGSEIMKKHNVLTVGKLWTKKKLVTALLIFFLELSSIIALLTYYGQNVGCFTISLSKEVSNYNVYISTDEEFKSYSPRLICDSFTNAQQITYTIINTNYVRKANGIYKGNGNTYVGYTYYVKNMGRETANLNFRMNIAQAEKNAEDVLWVWYFEGNDDSSGRMFQKKDDLNNLPANWEGYHSSYREREYFINDTTVFDGRFDLKSQEVKKFSLIIWLEGDDPDVNDQIVGGKINFNVEYHLYNEADKNE
jgi:hypothetical protein